MVDAAEPTAVLAQSPADRGDRLGMGVQRGDEPGERGGQHEVVVVEDQDVAAGRRLEPAIDGCRLATPRVKGERVIGDAARPVRGAVRGPVVDHDELERHALLRPDARDSLRQQRAAIAGCDDDGHVRGAHRSGDATAAACRLPACPPMPSALYILDRFPETSQTFVIREVRELHRRGLLAGIYVRRPGSAGATHLGADAVLPLMRLRPAPAQRATAVLRAALAAPLRTARALGWALRQKRHERGMFEAFADACVLREDAARADRLHAHFADWPVSVAVLASILSGTPCSFTTHAHDLYTADPAALRRKVRAARSVATVSDHSRGVLAAIAAPADRRRIHVVRNGVEVGTAHRADDQADGRPLVLCVARLVPKKGLDVLVDACARSRAGAGAEWLVLGDGPLRRELERRAAGRAHLRFAGAVDAAAVAAALSRATVFALPCRIAADGDHDGLPVALVEALAAGVPVVTTPVAGIPEVVEDGRSGLLVPVDDPDALAGAVDRLLGDATLRERLREGGLQAVQPYDLDRCIDTLVERLGA